MNKLVLFLFFLFSYSCVLANVDYSTELKDVAQSSNIAKQLENEVDGVAIRLLENDEYQIFSLGTGTYDFNDPEDILHARQEATIKAKANLSKFMNEVISTEDAMTSHSEKVKRLSSKNGEQSVSVDKESVKKTFTTICSNSSALLKEVIVLSAKTEPISENSGFCRVLVGVSSKTLEAVEKVSNGIATVDNGSNEVVFDNEGHVTSGTSSTRTSEKNDENTNSPTLEEGWIQCVGNGLSRQEAVSSALIEGISSVYGTAINSNTKYNTRINQLKVNSKALRVSLKDVSSNAETSTGGFVREYRVLSVNVLDNGLYEAVVKAKIINPRSNNTKAIMVYTPSMTIADKTKVYQLGPKKRLSGNEIANDIGKALCSAFVKQKEYIVFDADDVLNVVKQQELASCMVGAGLAPTSELIKTGQMLTADYILTSNINDIQYSKKLSMDKVARKFTPVYSMSIDMDFRITDVQLGGTLFANKINVLLTNSEISSLLEENEEVDLLSAILDKLVLELSSKINR